MLDSSIVSIRYPGSLAMLLSITTACAPATDLGFLLHKHPDRHQRFDLSFAKQFNYAVRFLPVGPEDKNVGAPSQMATFEQQEPAK